MKAKGSYSIEAAVITGLICLIYFIVMNVAISLFLEIRHEDEHKRQENLWIIEDFYRYKQWEEGKDD